MKTDPAKCSLSSTVTATANKRIIIVIFFRFAIRHVLYVKSRWCVPRHRSPPGPSNPNRKPKKDDDTEPCIKWSPKVLRGYTDWVRNEFNIHYKNLTNFLLDHLKTKKKGHNFGSNSMLKTAQNAPNSTSFSKIFRGRLPPTPLGARPCGPRRAINS